MRKLFLVSILVLICSVCASAEKIYEINSDVYVRSSSDGSVAGMLEKNDVVPFTGKSGGWYLFSVNGIEYKVWGEYVSEIDSDKSPDKYSAVKPSKSYGKKTKDGIYANTVKKQKITSSSPFYEINPF